MVIKKGKRIGRFELYIDTTYWALPITIEFASTGLYVDILCFTVGYRYKVICKSCNREISLDDIDKNLIMNIKEGGVIHWNCDDQF